MEGAFSDDAILRNDTAVVPYEISPMNNIEDACIPCVGAGVLLTLYEVKSSTVVIAESRVKSQGFGGGIYSTSVRICKIFNNK